MKTIHVKDTIHKIHMPHFHRPHMPSAHQLAVKAEHLLKDPRFWAIMAMVAVTALVITMAILTRPTGTTEPVTPVIPGPYIF